MNPKLRPSTSLTLCAAAVLSLFGAAQAQETAAPVTMERIQITGSSIKRLSGETALSVSVNKTEELDARGHTELKDLILELPQSLSLGTNSGAAGPVLNLRGLGPMRTLTLLNGRRMANEPLQDQYVSANVIPRMALDRVETLRDGASSIYGSDAIGGVQNYVTKTSFKGAKIKVELNAPERSPRGQTNAVGFIAGIGDLGTDGWNVYGTMDYQTKSALMQGDRPELFDGSALNQLGLLLTPSNKNQSPIANYGFSATANSNYNSSFATGCVAPYSLPTLGAGSVATPATYSNAGCYRDPNFFTAVSDGSRISNLYGKGTLNLGKGHRLTLELAHADFTVKKYRGMQLPSSNEPATTYNIPSTSKFYPGNGITPLVNVVGSNTGANSPAMYIDPVKTPGVVSPLRMNNRLVYFTWGPGELGNAYRNDQQLNDRMVLSAEGSAFNWDYRVGLNYGHSTRDTRTGGGYILYSKAQEGFTKGILNPFGPQDAAGLEYLKSIELRDYIYRKNEAFNKSVDATLTRELMDLGGGPLTLAITGELRRDEAKVSAAPLDYVGKLADGSYNISSAGVVLKDDIVGENPTGVAAKLHRNIKSAVVELDAPLTKQWTINGAVRSDTYSDLKTTTVNPKLSVRFQPTAELMLRASANTGFRAPSIMDIQNPTPEVRQVAMDDPVLCPSPTPTIANTGTPVSGFTAAQVCNVTTNYWTKSPDNSHLKPEKSKGWAVGGAFEPLKGLLVTVDYWGIRIDDVLGALTLAEVQSAPAKYAANILRNADGTINYILTSQANRGGMNMRGLDIAATYQLRTPSYGTFNFKLDGTYYDKYAFSVEKGGEFYDNIGILTGDGKFTGPNAGLATMQQIVYRWKHTASVNWRLGNWSTQLSQRYSSGLTDLTPRAGSNYTEVKAYKQYNLSASYSGFKSLKLGFGINNITDVNPPLTANTTYSGGYLTSGADILGRTFRFSAEYTFF
ncbi:TonB-dependent receptor domain-containing protein [Roseateles asaccharophilus]|uniref:Iron complex outermembrane receptor protein n=1 Tax=Roseateles asaccharophilus TaxID=582607 RepID=A0ABU2AFB8_9BURK|nr:TonB-dependent receptor [Roseateles asaccharophilus]MDR7335901.1 iron complex outermembrane receptor protein [Roseateles asaccharophilus]